MRKAVLFLILAGAVALLALTLALVREASQRSLAVPDGDTMPSTAIVFTGQFDRIELALALFDQDVLDRIFISGVNPGAGITTRGFADQFRISASALAALESGKIRLAPDANTTLENALETACWLAGQTDLHDIVLITGSSHMPRASWALERALGNSVSVRRLSPPSTAIAGLQPRWNVSEALKFSATVLITWLPNTFWPAARPAGCQ